jgi:hypothetical protein
MGGMRVPGGAFASHYRPPFFVHLNSFLNHSFFASVELKAILAHVLINYDVKEETEGVRPPDHCIGLLRFPNMRGRIMIRKRAE